MGGPSCFCHILLRLGDMALPMKAMKSMKSMKPAMKAAMKAMKPAMKAMKAKKAMKVSKIAKGKLARAVVFRGGKEKTSGGMTKDQLVKSKTGKIVSKKASARAKRAQSVSVSERDHRAFAQ